MLLFLALAAGACAGVGEKSPPDEVKTFFLAAREANLLGVMCRSPQQVDLSAYTSLMGVKYPPTDSVEVLSGPPSRPYQAFAVLHREAAPASSPSQAVAPDILAQFTAKAKAIGADALVICAPPGPGRPAKVEAVALKYRREAPEEKPGRP